MEAAVRQQTDRRTGVSDQEVNVTTHLAHIGALGWTIVTPPLGGMLAGRWLDHHLMGKGVLFSAALLLLGFGVGGWSAWNWMNHPHA
ncbi:ATP synthase subunit [Acetobacter sp. LMG 1627]|uniref:ATP synthase subunit n=2 Tax=Acetobacter conturbans TaxID=1737472 RepID=A0ABX0JX33_9PROT|nr:ATP synthase subunit [Acetobacter conturbans]